MAKPVSAPITTTPNTPSQGYDASASAPVGMFEKIDRNGQLDIHTGRQLGGDFASSGGTWKQT